MQQETYKSAAQFTIFALFISIGTLNASYCSTYLNDGLKTMKQNLNIQSSFIEGFIVSCLGWASCFSTILSMFIVEKMSRRQFLFLTDSLYIIGSCFVVFENVYMLCIGRIIQGLAIGFNYCLTSSMIFQMTPKSLIAITGGMNSIQYAVGIFTSAFIGLAFKNENIGDNFFFWRIYFALPIFFAVVRIVPFIFIYKYDSPTYYFQNEKQDKVKEFVQKYYKQEHVNDVLTQYELDYQQSIAKQLNFKDMVKYPHLKPILLGCATFSLQQFVGTNAVTFYSTKIFQSSFDDSVSLDLTLIFTAVRIVSYISASNLMKKFGRRTIIIGGSIFMSINLTTFTVLIQLANYYPDSSTLFNRISVPFLYCFLFGLFHSYGLMMSVYVSEFLSAKAFTIPNIVVLFWSALLTMEFPPMFDSLGGPNIFSFFTLMSYVCIFVSFKFIHETKGRTVNEIIALINGEKPQRSKLEETLLSTSNTQQAYKN